MAIAISEYQPLYVGDGGYSSLILGDGAVFYARQGEVTGTTLANLLGANDLTAGVGMTLGAFGLIANDTDRAATYVNSATGAASKASPTSVLAPQLDQSLEAWVKIVSLSTRFIFAYATDADNSYVLFINATGQIRASWEVAGSFTSSISSAAVGVISAGTTHHIVTTISSGGTITIYLDGLDVTSGASGDVAPNTTGTFFLGDRGTQQRWAGELDECAVYNTELTALQVEAHYKAGAGI